MSKPDYGLCAGWLPYWVHPLSPHHHQALFPRPPPLSHKGKLPAGWKDLLKTSSPYSDNHHYYSAEYLCHYPRSPAALQTIIITTTKVSPTGGSVILRFTVSHSLY